MTDTPRHRPLLELMDNFLEGKLAAFSFCAKFTKSWMRDRDAELAKKAAWSQPYDELLIAAFQRGEMSADEFRREHARLWDYGEDLAFQELVDALHSACSCYNPSPEVGWQIDEEQLRREVADRLAAYRASDQSLAQAV